MTAFPWELLGRLVDTPGGSFDVDAINRVGDLLTTHLEALGYAVARHPVTGHGDAVVAELTAGGDGPAPTLVLVGHSDTVWPADYDPSWRFTLGGTRAEGPGVGDMKAALLLAAEAGRRAVDALAVRGLGARVVLLVIPDEEVGSVASRPLVDRWVAEADLCVGLEAGKPGDGYVTSRGAVGAMKVEVTGRAVHVTEPGGVNALDALVPIATEVAALSGPEVLVSVCHLEAGASRQVAAGRGFLEVDLRADDDEVLEAAVDGVRRIAARVADGFAGEVVVHGGRTRPGLPVERSAEPWRLLLAVHGPGQVPFGVHERGGSDASTFAAAGVPTLDGFGPVCFHNCAEGEYVTVESVERRTALLADLLVAWVEEAGR
ncbi:M20/M25/M40 family metallo-hydrolase [Nocardioides sp. GY 10127]|uniref:M20/M25/M40 family metallo-hydrolase n=1 Tax=Nocardioides sp. GY 10127 TaxID=2569762 RepID=UPI00145896A1|nr:M20/M25/M40 family metallo-hydrolase [Nocardioides sp. GY 10127]